MESSCQLVIDRNLNPSVRRHKKSFLCSDQILNLALFHYGNVSNSMLNKLGARTLGARSRGYSFLFIGLLGMLQCSVSISLVQLYFNNILLYNLASRLRKVISNDGKAKQSRQQWAAHWRVPELKYQLSMHAPVIASLEKSHWIEQMLSRNLLKVTCRQRPPLAAAHSETTTSPKKLEYLQADRQTIK